MTKKPINRRDFLRIALLGAGAATMAACKAPTPEKIIERVVETVVSTQVVEKEVEKKGADMGELQVKMLAKVEELTLHMIAQEKKIAALEAENAKHATHDCTSHAETRLLAQASRQFPRHLLSHCTLYVNAEPCPMCQGAILWADIETA